MPWMETDPVNQRERFIIEALGGMLQPRIINIQADNPTALGANLSGDLIAKTSGGTGDNGLLSSDIHPATLLPCRRLNA